MKEPTAETAGSFNLVSAVWEGRQKGKAGGQIIAWRKYKVKIAS
jgi:hypothetical protein